MYVRGSYISNFLLVFNKEMASVFEVESKAFYSKSEFSRKIHHVDSLQHVDSDTPYS